MPIIPTKRNIRLTSDKPSWIEVVYRAKLRRHPFLLFGLPFISTILLASFVLTPATALRYEVHDRKHRTLSDDEIAKIGKNRRKVDMKEEYYRLSGLKNDDWEQVRVKRFKGEPDGTI